MHSREKEKDPLEWLKTAMLSGASGVAAFCVGQPADVLKTHIHIAPHQSYRSIASALYQNGLCSFYSGGAAKALAMFYKGSYRGPLSAIVPIKIGETLSQEFRDEHPVLADIAAVPVLTAIDALLKTPVDSFVRKRMAGSPRCKALVEIREAPYHGGSLVAAKDFLGWSLFLSIDTGVKKAMAASDAASYAPLVSASSIAIARVFGTSPVDVMLSMMQVKGYSLREAAIHGMREGAFRGSSMRLITAGSEAFAASVMRSYAVKKREESQLA